MSSILPNSIELSQKAQDELKQLLFYRIGEDIKNFSDEDIHSLGVLFLTITALAIYTRKQQRKTHIAQRK